MANRADGKDDLLLNKILGALLGSLLVWQVSVHIGDMLYRPQELETAAYVIDVPQSAGPGGEAAAVSLPNLLADASPENGARIAKKCASCHSFDKGGRNGTGPNLWGIVGAKRAHLDSFNYSNALESLGGIWDYQSLFEFLANPKKFLPDTSMTFIGLPKAKDRADILAYLQQQGDDPVPFPTPDPVLLQAIPADEAQEVIENLTDAPAAGAEAETPAAPGADTPTAAEPAKPEGTTPPSR